MTTINPHLQPLFEGFCKNYCKYRQKGLCLKTFDDVTLDKCPIPELWDINDHLNQIAKLTAKIEARLSREANSGRSS